MTWERVRKGKKKEQKVKRLFFFSPEASATPTLGPQPRTVPRGRGGVGNQARGPWADPSPGLPGTGLLGLGGWRARSGVFSSRDGGQGWREGPGEAAAAPRRGPPRGGRARPAPRGGGREGGGLRGAGAQLFWDAPWFIAFPAAPLPELSLGPALGRRCRPCTSKICQKRKS